MVIKSFEFKGQNYEIRADWIGIDLVIRAFRHGKPANGYSYHLSLDEDHKLSATVGLDGTREFVAMAERDVLEERWEKFLRLLSQSS